MKEALRQIRSKLAPPKETSPSRLGASQSAMVAKDDAPTENFSQ
jgi:hypothetical protein